MDKAQFLVSQNVPDINIGVNQKCIFTQPVKDNVKRNYQITELVTVNYVYPLVNRIHRINFKFESRLVRFE